MTFVFYNDHPMFGQLRVILTLKPNVYGLTIKDIGYLLTPKPNVHGPTIDEYLVCVLKKKFKNVWEELVWRELYGQSGERIRLLEIFYIVDFWAPECDLVHRRIINLRKATLYETPWVGSKVKQKTTFFELKEIKNSTIIQRRNKTNSMLCKKN
jgi:hypothetical protein